MKKRLNEDAVLSELREGSVFFQRPPATAAATQTPETPLPALQSSPEPVPPPTAALAPTAPPVLDLADYPTKTVTFPVTEQESLVLDELKLDIARTYQPAITATKERLLRLAIHYLVEDFRRNGEQSFAVQKLTKRPK